MIDFFQGIGKISCEGPQSENDVAFPRCYAGKMLMGDPTRGFRRKHP